MPQPTKAAPAGHAVDLSTRKVVHTVKAQSANPRPLSSRQLEELAKELPDFSDLPTIEELSALSHGPRARLILCPKGWTVEEAARKMLIRLRKARWTEGALHGTPGASTRRTFKAARPNFRVTGSAQSGSFTDCQKERGGVRITLTFRDRRRREKESTATDKLPFVPSSHRLARPLADELEPGNKDRSARPSKKPGLPARKQ